MAGGPLLVAYDRARAIELLREWSPSQLRVALSDPEFGAPLRPEERAELSELMVDWEHHALGEVHLRDAMLVDPPRGERAFALICAALTAGRGEGLARELVELARREGLELHRQAHRLDYPPPGDLAGLVPVPPPVARPAAETFQPPAGWRRWVALLLVVAGALGLLLPLLGGHIPEHPAGTPLALLTLGLLVGIGARWQGFVGSALIWLVANLPSFHHSAPLVSRWQALPLMAFGLTLLACDDRVRAMWRWAMRQLRGARPGGR